MGGWVWGWWWLCSCDMEHLDAPTMGPEADFQRREVFVDKGKPRIKARLHSSCRTGTDPRQKRDTE